jgi:polyferredoxin
MNYLKKKLNQLITPWNILVLAALSLAFSCGGVVTAIELGLPLKTVMPQSDTFALFFGLYLLLCALIFFVVLDARASKMVKSQSS